MKNITMKFAAIFLTVLFAGFSLSAQEKSKDESKMIVKVIKEGKTVLDTIYTMDEDFDQKKIEAMVEKLDGDSKTINIFKSKGGDLSSESEVYVIKKSSEGSGEGEIETKIEVIVDGKEVLHEFHGKEGDLAFFGSKLGKAHKSGNHKGEAVIHIETDGENVWTNKKDNVIIKRMGDKDLSWTVDEGEVHVNVEKIGEHGRGDFLFVEKEKKSQIGLDSMGDGSYRLEFVSDELEPILIEVFDGEGNRLFKKKVKNFYGRFLKEVELEGNETGLFTVRIVQGEREIIGEFEYK